MGAVAHDQFPPIGNRPARMPGCHFLRLQSTGRYFCAIDGYWRYIRTHDWHPSQGCLQVCLFSAANQKHHKQTAQRLYRAYPHAAIFAACDPEKPCITPGTYAFLGAAAALA